MMFAQTTGYTSISQLIKNAIFRHKLQSADTASLDIEIELIRNGRMSDSVQSDTDGMRVADERGARLNGAFLHAS